jgi:hypothetical protein
MQQQRLLRNHTLAPKPRNWCTAQFATTERVRNDLPCWVSNQCFIRTDLDVYLESGVIAAVSSLSKADSDSKVRRSYGDSTWRSLLCKKSFAFRKRPGATFEVGLGHSFLLE